MSANAKPTLALSRPSLTANATAAASKLAGGEARIVVDVPEAIHKALKIRAITRGVTIRQYVLELLAADGVTSSGG